jgi:hypothetical protein
MKSEKRELKIEKCERSNLSTSWRYRLEELQAIAKMQATTEELHGSAKIPKLPTFVDGKDDIDSYLRRFERFASTNKWNKSSWASNLSALLVRH